MISIFLGQRAQEQNKFHLQSETAYHQFGSLSFLCVMCNYLNLFPLRLFNFLPPPGGLVSFGEELNASDPGQCGRYLESSLMTLQD